MGDVSSTPIDRLRLGHVLAGRNFVYTRAPSFSSERAITNRWISLAPS